MTEVCGMSTIQYSARSARLSAVYFMHSTMLSVKALRRSDVSVICRVTYLQFPIQACFSSNVGQPGGTVAYLVHPISDIGRRRKLGISCTGRIDQGNDFELIPMVKIKTRHPVERSFGSEFPAICNHCGIMAA